MRDDMQPQGDVTSRRMKQVFVLFVIIGGFFIVAEHRVHLIPYLPWLLLAACPLMHVFMHRGHGGHRHHGNTRDSGWSSNTPPGPRYASSPRLRYTNPSDPSNGERS